MQLFIRSMYVTAVVVIILGCSGLERPKKAAKKQHDPVAELMTSDPALKKAYPTVAALEEREGAYTTKINGRYVTTIDVVKSLARYGPGACDIDAPNASVDIHLDRTGVRVTCSHSNKKEYSSGSFSWGWGLQHDNKLVLVFDGNAWQRQ